MESRRKICSYLIVITVVSGVLAIIYRDANLMYPLTYGNGDEMGVFYFVKTIKDFGISLTNPLVGGLSGGDMYDYIYSDGLSFCVVKLISLFFSDIYVITNVFYFACYILVACSSLFVCQKLHYSNASSIVISVLYAFSPFISRRYVHMWLTPYFMLPLSCYIAIKIVRGEIVTDIPFWKEKRVYKAVFVSFLCAFTGFYYAFFTCVLYGMALIIRLVNIHKDEIKKEIYVVFLIFSVVLGCLISVIPNVLYWLNNGVNENSELSIRQSGDAEVYGLKFIQMMLPRVDHRISFLGNLTQTYNASYPLVNENSTATLGLIASIGFIVSVIWLFQNRKKDKTLSYFNIGVFAVATIGGVGSLFSLLVNTPMRCYNRMSLIIMFFSLLCIASLLDTVRKKYTKLIFYVILIVVMVIGVFDQTVDYKAWDYSRLDSNKRFVDEIEKTLSKGDMVFEIPYVNWPSDGNYKMFVGYLESDTLHWSYGAMQARPEAQWQEWLSGREIAEMLNILFSKGYHGIYLDAEVYINMYGEDAYQIMYHQLCDVLGAPNIISEKKDLLFWSMKDYKLPVEVDQRYLKWLEVCPYYTFGKGFYTIETDGTDSWVWCNAESEMMVFNCSDDLVKASCKMTVSTGWSKNSELSIQVNGEDACEMDISSKGSVLNLPLELKPGKNVISFSCDAPRVEAPEDNRELVFLIRNIDVIIR